MTIKETSDHRISLRASGTPVYGAHHKKIGSIESILVDKTTGENAYAELRFGGFLGTGQEHHLVPWNVLRYDADLDEYSSDISGSRMRGGPKHGRESVFDWNARYAKLDGYHNEVVVSPG
jgi:hypothetical protein